MASTDKHNSAKTNATIFPYYLLSTVTENKEFYTRAYIEGVDRARRYKVLWGWTATSAFNNDVNNELLLKCNMTVDDINISEDIYWGSDIHSKW